MMTFKFNNEYVAQSLINIDDIGNFALEGVDEHNGFFYYLLVKTTLGTTTILTFGPVVPDVKLLPDYYNITYQRLQFKDKVIYKYINMWLNDKIKKISNAQLIEEDVLLNELRDIKDYILNYGEEVY